MKMPKFFSKPQTNVEKKKKPIYKRIWVYPVAFFGILFLIGIVQGIMNPEAYKESTAPKEKAAEKQKVTEPAKTTQPTPEVKKETPAPANVVSTKDYSYLTPEKMGRAIVADGLSGGSQRIYSNMEPIAVYYSQEKNRLSIHLWTNGKPNNEMIKENPDKTLDDMLEEARVIIPNVFKNNKNIDSISLNFWTEVTIYNGEKSDVSLVHVAWTRSSANIIGWDKVPVRNIGALADEYSASTQFFPSEKAWTK